MLVLNIGINLESTMGTAREKDETMKDHVVSRGRGVNSVLTPSLLYQFS